MLQHELFSFCSEQGLLFSCSVWASHCSGFSGCGVQALGHTGFSSCGSQAPEHRLNSCGIQVSLPQGLGGVPGSGIESISPALAGRFFTIEPPGKHISSSLNRNDSNLFLSGIIVRIYIEHLVCSGKHSVLAVNIVD